MDIFVYNRCSKVLKSAYFNSTKFIGLRNLDMVKVNHYEKKKKTILFHLKHLKHVCGFKSFFLTRILLFILSKLQNINNTEAKKKKKKISNKNVCR